MRVRFIILLAILSVILYGIEPNTFPSNFNYNHDNSNSPKTQRPYLKNGIDYRSWRLSKIMAYNNFSIEYQSTFKWSFFYNETIHSQLDSILIFFQDSNNPSFGYSGKRIYHYDTTGEYITGADYYDNWNEQHPTMVTCVYDNQQRLTHFYQYCWDNASSEYGFANRVDFTYDDTHLTELQMINFNNNPTNPVYLRDNYFYDSHDRVIESIGSHSSDSLNWVNDSFSYKEYHPNDVSNSALYVQYISHDIIHYMFDIWQEYYKFGMVAEETSGNYYEGNWYYGMRYCSSYDDNNNLTTYHAMQYNDGWQNYRLNTYSYDENNNLDQYTEQHWDYSNTQWEELANIKNYTWEQYTANQDDTEIPVAFSLSVYPNPFASSVNIVLQSKSNAPVKAAVYNIKGQLIKTLDSSKALIWDGTDTNNQSVSNGIYFIKAEQDGRTVTSKVIRIK